VLRCVLIVAFVLLKSCSGSVRLVHINHLRKLACAGLGCLDGTLQTSNRCLSNDSCAEACAQLRKPIMQLSRGASDSASCSPSLCVSSRSNHHVRSSPRASDLHLSRQVHASCST
jgi:hypothetical protein